MDNYNISPCAQLFRLHLFLNKISIIYDAENTSSKQISQFWLA